MLRVLIAPFILLFAALGFFNLDAWRRAHCYGWTSHLMDEHWHRLYRERTFHAAKNVMSEWVRLDPQRAGKVFSFLVILAFAIGIVL